MFMFLFAKIIIQYLQQNLVNNTMENNTMENKEKIESLKEIFDISELNTNLSQFQSLNEFIKQGLMFIALKKGKKENVSEEDINLFKSKLLEVKQIIENIIS